MKKIKDWDKGVRDTWEKDPTIKRIRAGKDIVMFIEPLADFSKSAFFCPEKEECITLGEAMLDEDKAWDIIESGSCRNCPSHKWIMVACSVSGMLMSATCSPDFGEYIKAVLEDLKNSPKNISKNTLETISVSAEDFKTLLNKGILLKGESKIVLSDRYSKYLEHP